MIGMLLCSHPQATDHQTHARAQTFFASDGLEPLDCLRRGRTACVPPQHQTGHVNTVIHTTLNTAICDAQEEVLSPLQQSGHRGMALAECHQKQGPNDHPFCRAHETL